MKVPRPSVPAHWAADEAEFTAAVRDLGAPAPAVLDVVQVQGRDAIVFERVWGPSMWDLILDGPKNAAAFGQELADIHQQILRAGLPVSVSGLVGRMQRKISEIKQFSEVERDRALQVLEVLPARALRSCTATSTPEMSSWARLAPWPSTGSMPPSAIPLPTLSDPRC